MQAPAPSLTLLVDPAFRCSVALVHAVRPLALELHLGGRVLRVSHDPAFRPVLAPCHLRLAMAQAAAGTPPDWLAEVTGWTVGGPLVEPLGGGVVAHADLDGPLVSFATTLTPLVVRGVAHACDAGDEDLDVVLRPDAAVGATVVEARPATATGPASATAPAVGLAAVLLAAACREREQALRAAPR